MEIKAALSNNICVQMDPENDFIEMASGIKLAVDTSFEPEKHIVRTGTVEKVPRNLNYSHQKPGYPWQTDCEIQEGDRVVMYFMAVQNCLAPERKHYIREGKTVWIFIKYHNIYCIIRDGQIIPINGYVLVEPVEDPAWLRKVKRAKMNNFELPDLRKVSNTHVTYGKIAYLGEPNIQYADDYKTDDHVNIKVGDTIVMKRITDIPVEYEYHAKLDGGRKLYRLQRHQIMAVL